MKKSFYLFSIACVGMLFTSTALTSCSSDDDPEVQQEEIIVEEIEEPETGDRTVVVSSSESATISNIGFRLTVPMGAVPKNNSGTDGRVAFSISHISNEELPAPVPSGCSIINEARVKIEPMNFVFNTPLTMKLPSKGINISNIQLLHYNEYTSSWENVPFSIINSDGTVSVSIIELGYFILVKKTTRNQMGGVRILNRYLDENYFYYLTLIPANNSNESIKRISFAPNGNNLYMTNVPLGKYIAIVARELRNSLNDASQKIEYYNTNIYAEVKDLLTIGDGNYDTYGGWTDLTIGNNWFEGRPDDAWGQKTTTYGTGKFQATLTWVNSSEGATDYDLHLFGPNNMHVFYSDKRSSTFELDRDWLTEYGNAIENIYSINDTFTPGEYQVKVHHYSGTLGRRYNCRVIVDGIVVKSVSGSISTNKQFDDIYSFTVDQ